MRQSEGAHREQYCVRRAARAEEIAEGNYTIRDDLGKIEIDVRLMWFLRGTGRR